MTRNHRLLAVVAALGALALVPATAPAKKGGNSGSKGCKVVKKAFVVKGTLVSYTADDPATPADESSVTLTVTKANRHANKSGELEDADAGTAGTQVTFGAADDAFVVKLSGYDGATDTPSAGDKVKVKGKVPYTKKRCAPDGTSVEDRYGEPDVKRVKLVDKD